VKGVWFPAELEFAACMIARNYQVYVQVLDASLEVKKAWLPGKMTTLRILADLTTCERLVERNVTVAEMIGRPAVVIAGVFFWPVSVGSMMASAKLAVNRQRDYKLCMEPRGYVVTPWEPGAAGARPLCVADEIGRGERLLVTEEPFVHLPVLALVAGTLGGLGGAQRIGVDLFERQVADDVAQLAGGDVVPLDLRHRLLHVTAAERALEVRELHQDERGAVAALREPVADDQLELLGHHRGRRAPGAPTLAQRLDVLQVALHRADAGLEGLDL